jgi:hypothetical protein
MILDKLFQLMAEKQASDIFISAGAPIHIKIQGNTIPVNQQVMLPDMIEKIAYELMSPDQIKTFEASWEMNLSFGVPQRRQLPGQHLPPARLDSIVIRFILGNIPPSTPRPADHPRRTDHGKARPDPDRRRHRFGQVDDHRLDARSPQRQSCRPHPDRRGPDRIPVQTQEIHRQPARNRHGYAWTGRRR